MADRSSRTSRRRLFGLLGLLLLLAALLPLGAYLAGTLPGGGRFPDRPKKAGAERRAGTLRVVVQHAEDRSPLEGARIRVRGWAGGEANATSGASGEAFLESLGRGPFRVEAVANGRRSSAWIDPEAGSEIRLSVAARKSRAGSVRDPAGAPVPDAEVRLLDGEGRVLARTRSGSGGLYELEDQPEAVAVCASAPGGRIAVAASGDLLLDQGETISGRILGAGAGPLEVYGRVPSMAADRMLPLRAIWTLDENGAFSANLPPGAQAWGLWKGLPVRIRAGETRLSEPATAEGRVRLEDGSPAGRASLTFRPLLEDDFPVPLPALKVDADADGRFEASGFAAVAYLVEVHAPDCAARRFNRVVPGGAPLDLVLEPGFSLRGFVVDSAGLPVPGARLRAIGLPAGEQDRPILATAADDRGSFELAGLGGTFARLHVAAEGYFSTTLDRATAGAKLRVVLQRR